MLKKKKGMGEVFWGGGGRKWKGILGKRIGKIKMRIIKFYKKLIIRGPMLFSFFRGKICFKKKSFVEFVT